MTLKHFLQIWILIIFSGGALAQTNQVWLPGSTPDNTVVARNNLFAVGALAPGRLDTTGSVVPLQIGAMRVRPQDSLIYVWNGKTSGKKWYVIGAVATVTSVNGQTGVVTLTIPTNTNQLANGSGYITSAGAPVQSVNGHVGIVTIDGSITYIGGDSHIGVSGSGTSLAPYLISFPRANFDTVKGRYVDTSTGIRNAYVLSYDSVNRKWYMAPPGTGGGGAVSSFNTRTGAVVLLSGDVITALGFTPENAANKGVAGGYASLDGSTLVPIAQLPAPTSGDASSSQLVKGNDTRLANSRAPSGSAGGDLTGTYPNPTVAANKITYAQMQAAAGQGLLGATAAGNHQLITLGTNLSMSGSVLNATSGGGGTLSRVSTGDSITNGSSTVIDKDNANNDAWHNKNYLPNFEPTLERAKRKTCYFGIGALGDSFIDGLRFETAFKNGFGDRFSVAGPGMMSSDASNLGFGGSTDLATAHWTKQLGNGLDLWSIKSTSISTDIDFANSGTDRGGFNLYDSIRFFYLIKTGGGTFQIKLLTTVLATVNTSTGTNGTLGIVALSGFDPSAANDFIIHQTAFNSVGVEILGYKAFLKGGGIVVNRIGHSGAVTQDYLTADSTIQAQLLQEAGNDILYMCIGINDRRQVGGAETIGTYHINMRRLINRIKLATPKTKIVLMAQPEYDENIWGGEANTAIEYANEIRKISLLDTCGFIDMARILGDSTQMRRDSVLEDGLHPSYASWGGPLVNNMLGMIPGYSNAIAYTPWANYDFKTLVFRADFHKFQDKNGVDLAAVFSGSSPSFRLYSGGADTYKAGINLGPGYMVMGMNNNNLFGVNTSYFGGAIMFDGRFITAPIRFDIQSATPGTAGGIGDNLKWQFGSATEFPLVGGYFDYTDALRHPVGTTAQRPTGGEGYLRANHDSLGAFINLEAYNPSRARWERLASKAALDSLSLLIGGATSITVTRNAVDVTISSSTGSPGTLAPADATHAGALDTARAKFIDSLRLGGGLKLLNRGIGINTAYAIGDTINLKTILGANSISITADPDSTNRVQLVNDSSLTAALYGYGTNAAGRKGWYALPVGSTTANYTSTFTNTANITSSTFVNAVYTRTGNTVTVRISGGITPTTTLTNTTLTVTLPFTTSNTSQTGVGSGVLQENGGGQAYAGMIVDIASGTTATIKTFVLATSSGNFSATFIYTL